MGWFMSNYFFGITWASTHQLPWLLILTPITVLLLVLRFNKTRLMVKQLVSVRWRTTLLTGFSFPKLMTKLFLLGIGMILLLLALMRPQWYEKEKQVQQEGRDLFIAIDISRSMLAQDVKPNRLECAKTKIKELIKQLPAERVGLIVFAGSALIQCPLTTDFNTFMLFLDQIDDDTISSGTTAIEQAIEKALKTYEQMRGKKNKLLVIVTDGEDFSRNLRELKNRAQQQGMRIFTLGIGTPQGAPIPLINEKNQPAGYLKDEYGKLVMSPLNEGILSSLAHDVGGVYIKVTDDDTDIKKIVNWVSHFEKEQFEDTKISAYEEQYPWFVGLSFVCFAIEWIL